MAQATVFNPTTKERKVVTVGDPNAFAGGFILETPTNNLQTYKAPTPVNPSAPSATPIASTGASYAIKSGDTLSAIAKAQGTTVAELMKANPSITNPNMIYAGKSLALPGGQAGDGTGVADYSGVANVADANKAINEGQQKTADALASAAEPPTRKTTDQIIADITTKVTPTTPKPASTLTEALTGYRTQYDVGTLETQLDELRAQQQELYATKQTRTTAERGKTVAMNVIEGRVGEVERQENERIAAVERSIANTTNQLNTKYNIINTLMKTTESDYDNAVASYDKQMANNISIFNAAQNIDEANKSEEQKATDDARSNAQIALNAYVDAGTSYDQLSAAEKTSLTKLGVQSGLGADFFNNLLKAGNAKSILTTITSADDTKVSVIYKDGTTKTISTGLPAKKTSTGAAATATADEIKLAYKGFMQDTVTELVKNAPRGDQYLSPQEWNNLRQQWTSNSPYSGVDFDDTFRGYVNPEHPFDYAGFEEYRKGFKK